MIKNVIFDLGRVIINFDPKQIIKEFCTDNDILNEIEREIFNSHEWVMMDEGVLDEKTFLKNAKLRLSENACDTAEKVFLNWHKHLNYIPETVNIIYELKDKGYKIYLLSNIGERAYKIVKDNDVFNVFDDMIFSCDVKMVKPDIKIFEYAIQRFGINANESIFVDDAEENVKSAIKAGLNGVVFKNASDAVTQIRKIITKSKMSPVSIGGGFHLTFFGDGTIRRRNVE